MDEFKQIITELILLFEHLCEVEQRKLAVVQKSQVTYLEDCMNEEQAAILKMRGLDSRREKCQERLGWKGDSFRQILDKATDTERDELQPLFASLSHQVAAFRDLSDSAKTMIEINLHQVNKAIAAQQGERAPLHGSLTSHKI